MSITVCRLLQPVRYLLGGTGLLTHVSLIRVSFRAKTAMARPSSRQRQNNVLDATRSKVSAQVLIRETDGWEMSWYVGQSCPPENHITTASYQRVSRAARCCGSDQEK